MVQKRKRFFLDGLQQGRLMLELASELVLGEMMLLARTSIKYFLPPLKRVDQTFTSKIKESRFHIDPVQSNIVEMSTGLGVSQN